MSDPTRDGEPVAEDFADLQEEAWGLLGDGDLPEAQELLAAMKAIAAEAGESSREMAEVWALAGVIAAVQGAVPHGLEVLSRAADAFPEVARYPLLGAEMALRFGDDLERAETLCNQALDVATEEDDLIDAVLLKAEALVGMGDRDDDAREILAELEGCAIGDPMLLCQAADMQLAIGDLDAALRAYRRAAKLEPSWADAHHGIGMIHEARGERQHAAQAWLRTRELDLAAPLEPWHMSIEELEEIVVQALAELPEVARERLANVPVLIEDAPSLEQVADGIDPRLLGLFSGIPLPHKSHIVDGQIPQVDSIHLYQRNLERAATGRDNLAEEIRITVLHETAHFFGLEDDDLDAIGLG